MQKLEEDNNKNAVEAASQQENAGTKEIEAVVPSPATASPSVSHVTPTNSEEGAALTATTAAPHEGGPPVATAKVHQVPANVTSSRLSSAPVSAPAGTPASPAPAAESAAAATAEGAYISIDDFAKVELRVAQVLVAERIPKADKLLRLEVDLGYEKRQILAGIAQFYEPEKLIGRKIVIVANLAPRKMRGLESNGMLLAASLPDGAPVLAGFLEEVPLGARLK
jgi:methionyl-tRNA synthetase